VHSLKCAYRVVRRCGDPASSKKFGRGLRRTLEGVPDGVRVQELVAEVAEQRQVLLRAQRLRPAEAQLVRRADRDWRQLCHAARVACRPSSPCVMGCGSTACCLAHEDIDLFLHALLSSITPST